MKIFRKYLGVIVGIIFLTIIFFHDRLKDYDKQRYNTPPSEAILSLNKMKFEDVTKGYGLGDVSHTLYFPNDDPIVQKYLPFITVTPYVSIFDLNNDGFMDLFFLEPAPDKPDRLFLNEKGKKFTEVTGQFPMLADKGTHGANVSVWADFNNDGKLDYFTNNTPCYRVFLQTEDLKFSEVKNNPKYCSFPFALNVLDFNRDGNLDIAVANYHPARIVDDPSTSYKQLVGRAGKHPKGESNFIFLGDGKGGFNVFNPQALAALEGRSTTVGVSYIDEDLWPDLFISNDFTFDEMYLSVKGRDLQDVTRRFISRRHHGFSGMNSDFADVNNDGFLDLYVTNGWGPPSAMSENLLWQKDPRSSRFVEQARSMGADKCGWGWGAKLADYDLDGDLDIFVTNGIAHGSKAKSFKDSKSWNYLRTQVRSIPEILRENIFSFGDKVTFNLADSNFQIYGFDRNCMYMQHGGKYYDVAEQAHVDDTKNGRSIALLDIENDGKLDIVIGNTGDSLILYRNVSGVSGNWVAFDLVNEKGTPYHGAIIKAARTDGVPLREELFIGNGGRGINDPRIHFGLGQHDVKDKEIVITWPDGKREVFKDIKINQYNKVQYGRGAEFL